MVKLLKYTIFHLTSNMIQLKYGNIASVQTLAQTVDGYGTKWATKLDSNGYITGLVMVNNGQGKSATVFHTDSFLVGKPGVNGGSPQYAFVIGKVNGRYGVAMNSAFIQDLSVGRLKIKERNLTATATQIGRASCRERV